MHKQTETTPTCMSDADVFELVHKAQQQFAEYIELQDTVASLTVSEPEIETPYTMERPLSIVIQGGR